MIPFPQYQEPVVVLRAPLVAGPYGGQTRNWATAQMIDEVGIVQPLSSSEDSVDQTQTQTRWRLYLSPDADLLATDRVRWAGVDLEVDGDVERWPRHTRAVLRKVTQEVG